MDQTYTSLSISMKLPVYIPRAAVWLLRLAVNSTLSRSLQNDPVAFPAWYATIGGVHRLELTNGCG
jgi:hypothetical protein